MQSERIDCMSIWKDVAKFLQLRHWSFSGKTYQWQGASTAGIHWWITWILFNQAYLYLLLDRNTDHFVECSIGIVAEILPGNVALVALTHDRKCKKAVVGVIPLELLLIPCSSDSDNEHLFA